MDVEDLLIKHEGSKNVIYPDSLGKPTIGIGHCLQGNPLPVTMQPPLSQMQIDQLFQADLAVVMKDLKNLDWFPNLDEVRQAVIIDMTFNMGWPTFQKFHNTLLLIEQGKYNAAAEEMLLSLWAKQLPNRAKENSLMMATGLWPDNPNFPKS
jgi:lysozyme